MNIESIAQNTLETSLFVLSVFVLVAAADKGQRLQSAFPALPYVGGLAILLSVAGIFISIIVLIWVR